MISSFSSLAFSSSLDKYYFYHRFGLKAFEGRHIRMINNNNKK
jgi:hypothetical protein